MRSRLTIIVLAVFASANGQTTRSSAQQTQLQLTTVSVEHMISWDVLGKHYKISIDERMVSSSPSWNRPDAKQPPLSIKEALRISEKSLLKYVDDPKQWRVDTVALRSIGKKSKWYYLISWHPQWSGYIGDGIYIAVLMNGVPVEPKVELQPGP